MVDPNVHFHVIPRYDGSRSFAGMDVADAGWPGPPDLKSAAALDDAAVARMKNALVLLWHSADTNAS